MFYWGERRKRTVYLTLQNDYGIPVSRHKIKSLVQKLQNEPY